MPIQRYKFRYGDGLWCRGEDIAPLEAELGQIDEALARRPALADLDSRRAKIERACLIAGKAEAAEAERDALKAETVRLAESVAVMRPYYEAVRAYHNGYDPEARAAMPGLREPITPHEAIRELLAEEGKVLRAAIDELRAENAELKAQVETLGPELALEREGGEKAALEIEALKAKLAAIEARRCETCFHALPILASYKQPDKRDCALPAEQHPRWVHKDHGCLAWAPKEEGNG